MRLSLDARSSRARIRLLETDEPSRSKKLIHIFAQLERGMEDVVVDMMDEGSSGASTPLDAGSPTHTDALTFSADAPAKGSGTKSKPAPEQPMLTPSQLRMVAALNALPNLRKQLAFIEPTRNSHAQIVCRDVKRFETHRRGEGVIRHWADHFVL